MFEISSINRRKFRPAVIVLTMMTALLSAGCGSDSPVESVKIKRFSLNNGMEVILKANHASPMITSMVFVKAGAKHEHRYNNGATHFLEHLLFNGTAARTQEDIDKGIEKLGGYINAFTRKEFTAFLVLMPQEFIEYGMATQADMLFNSVFPEERFPKERGIVNEEIKMGDDAESAPVEAFFEMKAYDNTPYSKPIIGYEPIISNIPREAIIDYYRRFYAPNNMTLLIIGDFEMDAMTDMVENVFGSFPSIELPAPPEYGYQPLEGKQVFRTDAPTKSTYVSVSVEAPHFTDSGYHAFAMIEDYLNDTEHSPLAIPLKSGTSPLATNVSVYLDTKEELTRLNIEVISEKSEKADTILTICENALKGLANNAPTDELLSGYKISRRCNEIYMAEKLHYYGFVIAPLLAITGWDFFTTFQDNIDSVTVDDIKQACGQYLTDPGFIATIVTPLIGTRGGFAPSGPTEAEVLAYYNETEIPAHDLNTGKNFKMPAVGKPHTTEKHHATYLKETLENGLTVIVKSNPDSRVFALNVLGQNRSANEPPGKDGITDFVNRMIEKGTITRPGDQLSAELSRIGAKVSLTDIPWLSHDDRYTTRQFSFMKFETIDEFTEEGIGLFADMIANPAFDSVDIEQVRQEMFGLAGRLSGSTYQSAGKLFYETLFEGTPYARTISGTYRTLSAINRDDLIAHHKKIYSPENMIITVGTNFEASRVMSMLREQMGKIPATGFVSAEPSAPEKPNGVVKANEKMDKEQVYIYMGNILPAVSSPDSPALSVASAVLSNRLQANLREKQGLAYTVGAGAVLDKNFGWLLCTMGTGVDNFEKARDGILDEIEKMKDAPPTQDKLDEAINGIWGSYLSANLSRINQAYYMGVYEYLGLGFNYADSRIESIRAVTPEQVHKVSREYFDTKNYVIATAGDL